MNLFEGVNFNDPNPAAIGTLLATGLTIFIYSFLYKDNPFYRLAEHIYVGISTGYLMVITFKNALLEFLIRPLIEAKNPGDYIVIIPGILGILMLSRFFQKYAWLSRFTLAFVIGAGAGISVPNQVHAYLLRHSSATLEGFSKAFSGFLAENTLATKWALLDNVLILVGVISVLIYFFFSIAYNKALKGVSRVGVIYLMIFFGAAFGYTVMARVSLLIGRMSFLFDDTIRIIRGFGK